MKKKAHIEKWKMLSNEEKLAVIDERIASYPPRSIHVNLGKVRKFRENYEKP